MRGIDTSSTARSISAPRTRSSASAPSPASATTRRSGSASSTSRRPAAHHRVVVGDQQPRREAGRHARRRVAAAPSSRRLGRDSTVELGADQHRALAHAAQPGALAAPPVEARAVVAAPQLDAPVVARARAPRARVARRVARDVGQRLLRDAVDRPAPPPGPAPAAPARCAARPAGPSAATRRPSAPPARSPGRGRRAPPGAAGGRSRAPPPGSRAPPRAPPRPRRARRPVSRATRSSCSTTAVSACPTSSCSSRAIRTPLALLRRQRPPRALAPLALQPVDHLVERPRQLRHLGVGRPRPPPARPGCSGSTRRMNAAQPRQRRERAPQQHEVEPQHRRQPAASTTASVSAIGKHTVAGESTSTSVAARAPRRWSRTPSTAASSTPA